jgi:hypothetical protein
MHTIINLGAFAPVIQVIVTQVIVSLIAVLSPITLPLWLSTCMLDEIRLTHSQVRQKAPLVEEVQKKVPVAQFSGYSRF